MPPRPVMPGCLRDPLSIAGLRKLQREQPDWAAVVGDHLPEPPELVPTMTTRAALKVGVLDWNALRRLGANGYRRHRQACGLAAKIAGAMKLGQITDAELKQVAVGLGRRKIAPESASRALTVLRALARALAEETGGEPQVTSRPARRPPGRRTRRRRAKRPLWSPEEVAALLAALRDRAARVAVALAVGCGLMSGEVLHLALADLDLKKRVVLVHGADRSKRARVMPLPAWVVDLIQDYLGLRRLRSSWLLPSSRDPRKPRGDFNRLLQAAQRRAGGLHHHPPVTMRDLRRSFQAVVIRGGLPSEAVRGTWVIPTGGSFPSWWPRLQRLVRVEWKTLCGLDRGRWPRSARSFVKSYGRLVPEDVADVRRLRLREPPPLPASVGGA